MPEILDELLSLSHRLGRPEAGLAILGEGSVSARLCEETFLVKASGFALRDLAGDGVLRVRFAPILRSMDEDDLTDAAVEAVLAGSRCDPIHPVVPSTDTFLHAFLLGLPEVRFVGHTHPTPLMSLLCTELAEEIAIQRLFPDEVTFCGPASCYVPYADPGVALARELKDRVGEYVDDWGTVPKTIWLKNHGLVCIGRTAKEVESATFMSKKAAEVWLGAFATGQSVTPLDEEHVERIHTRPDENYRRRLLWHLDG